MRKEQIISQLHPIQRDSDFIKDMSNTVSNELNNLDSSIRDYGQQLNIDLASWAIPIYEKELGILTDITMPLSERRSMIKAKLRGSGKIGIAEIQAVATAWAKGEVDVEFVQGTIEITFINTVGSPAYLDNVKRAINLIVPAHLKVIYNLIYNTYRILSSKTHAQLSGYTHLQLRNTKIS